MLLVHRYSWELHNGSTRGLSVLHKCDNRKCINAEHLFLDTQLENVRDMVSKGRHIRGEKAPRAKLTDEQVAAIITGAAQGESQKDLAAKYGVCRPQISKIVNRKQRKEPIGTSSST